MSKTCTKCRKVKPLSEFPIYNGKVNSHCKQCRRDYGARYRNTPKGIYHNIKNREALRKRKPFKITEEEFLKWFEVQSKQCYYCGISWENAHLMRKHFGAHGVQLSVDCMENDKGYVLGNIVLACDRCNFIKSNIFTSREMKEIGEKFIKPKWQSFPEITKQSEDESNDG